MDNCVSLREIEINNMNIIQSPSPNFNSRGGSIVDTVVIHCTDGTFPGDLGWLRNTASQVSSHYLVAPNGDIHQLVAEKDRAWCNGRVDKPTAKLKKNMVGGYVNPNDYTVSIEVSTRATDGIPVVQREALKALVKDICTRNGIPVDRDHIWGHKEIYSLKTCPGTISVDMLVKDLAPAEDKEAIKQQIRDLLAKL